MNAPVLQPLVPPRRLMAADVMFLVENGLIDPNAKFELMDGAIIPMSPKGRHHEAMRERLEDWLTQPWAAAFRIIREHTLALDAETLVEPDFLLYDRTRSVADGPLTAGAIHLVIEVADSSWGYDTREKAAKYAAFGVAEYWAIHAVRGVTLVHRAAKNGAWTDIRETADPVAPLGAPGAPLALS